MKLKYTSTNEYGLSRGSERAAAFDLRADKDYHFGGSYRDWETDRKSTRLNSSHITRSRMPSSA